MEQKTITGEPMIVANGASEGAGLYVDASEGFTSVAIVRQTDFETLYRLHGGDDVRFRYALLIDAKDEHGVRRRIALRWDGTFVTLPEAM